MRFGMLHLFENPIGKSEHQIEELRALVESLLCALPAGDAPLAPDRDAEGPEP